MDRVGSIYTLVESAELRHMTPTVRPFLVGWGSQVCHQPHTRPTACLVVGGLFCGGLWLLPSPQRPGGC
ncbi:unnamed protein product [Arctogadus glacialis]